MIFIRLEGVIRRDWFADQNLLRGSLAGEAVWGWVVPRHDSPDNPAPKGSGDIHRVFERMPFVKPLITALLGIDPGDQLTAQMTQAFLWVHPTVLTLMWAHEVMYCTRCPAGEVDRGTIDFLMSLPVSRWRVFLAESLGWILSGLFIVACGLSGHLIASRFIRPEMQSTLPQVAFVFANLMCLYLAVGSFTFLVSSRVIAGQGHGSGVCRTPAFVSAELPGTVLGSGEIHKISECA